MTWPLLVRYIPSRPRSDSSVGAAIAQLAANPPAGVTTLYDAEIVKLAKEFRASQQASPAK